ncbi:MAG: hypothetical protein V1702_05125, partial [Candidatus Woesearchaeota archaeon]
EMELSGIIVTKATPLKIVGVNVEPIYSQRQAGIEAYVFSLKFLDRPKLMENAGVFGIVIPYGFQYTYAAGREYQVAGDILERIKGLNPQGAKSYMSKPTQALWIAREFSPKGEDCNGRMTTVLIAYAPKLPAQAHQL